MIKMKYGLISYDYTVNLGNEIQSIAARRFLPKIDYYIDHEKINKFDEDCDVKLIMNGWYLDCLKAWPPSKNINPLLISMHFNHQKKIQDVILSEDSREILTEYGPVGCRDLFTQNFLNDNGIDAYFSGCLTLTLDSGNKYNQKDEDNGYILVSVDEPKEIIQFLKQKTDKKIYVLYQDFLPGLHKAFLGSIRENLYNRTTFYTFEEKMYIAENFLRLYENADCIITDRLHCALPGLALKTPTLFFNSRRNPQRFEGLEELTIHTVFEEYEKNYNIFDVDNPPENPKDYLKIRKDLIKRCEKFTGCVNESCFSDITYNKMLDNNTLFISRHSYETREYIREVLKLSKDYNKKIDKKQETIDKKQETIDNKQKTIDKQKEKHKKAISDKNKIIKKQKELIKEYENSTSWKITAPLRKVKNKISGHKK